MDSYKRIKISVRNLVEFVLKSGDLYGGYFVGSQRATAGTRGHQQVQKARPEGYLAEVSVSLLLERDDLELEISGRIDGIYTNIEPLMLDEIKTTTLALDLVHEDHNLLHWAQVQCYAYIYARQHQLPAIGVQLTYFQLDSRQTKTFQRQFTFAELETFFNQLIAAYLQWAKMLVAWYQQRDQSIQALDFPYPVYRAGQRDLAVAVYKTIQNKTLLFAQAPTGIGKTIATLFPAAKALGLGLITKIFYLTAKTPGRIVAEKAIDDMRQAGLHLKSITLTAKDKICFCPASARDPDSCEYARGYYDKVQAALEDIFQQEAFTRPVIEAVAEKHQICPFEFSLDLSLWADCIICDYNYAFDPRVYLRRFFDNGTSPYLFLIDEAHNFPDRAREMFSAELEKRAVLDLRKELKAALPDLANSLNQINQLLLEKRKACQAAEQRHLIEYERPDDLLNAIRQFVQRAESWLIFNQQTPFREALLDFYFQCNAYLRTADNFSPVYVSYFERQGQSGLKAKLYCLDPAPLLAEGLARGQAAIFFSATLLPIDYFQQLLTGTTDCPAMELPSPFPQENTRVLIHNRIATTYRQRADSYGQVAATIEALCLSQPGNYLVYFPSYAYLEAVAELLDPAQIPQQMLIQNRQMTEPEREQFLDQFSESTAEHVLGLAVMGGIFGEGIDLVGDRLIGALIVGVGLPQLSLERDLIKDYFNQQNNQGFQYAYQYPGLNRVLQAAGRVIRTEIDRGVIVLLDERFTQHRYTRLFPAMWHHFQAIQNAQTIQQSLTQFWTENNK